MPQLMGKYYDESKCGFDKIILLVIVYLLLLTNSSFAQEPYEGLKNWSNSKNKRMEWFRQARFGMFIHWGLYAGAGGVWKDKSYPEHHYAEWLQSYAHIPSKEYAEVLKPKFTASKFDAGYWAKLAKGAGMKYVIITSRHHEGFTLFNSKEPFSLNNDVTGGTNISPVGRDLYGELVSSFKEQDLKVGAYYSLWDWQNPNSYDASWNTFNLNTSNYKPNHDLYKQYIYNQIMELATNYPALDVFWPDFSSKDRQGEAWGTKKILQGLMKAQPGIITNNRFWDGIENKNGDFGTPEKYVPPTGLPGMDWEVSHTMNESYGYSEHDNNWKSYDKIMRLFIETVSKGGNFLLNVGPNGEGEIPQQAVTLLTEIGQWMHKNSDAIYGTTASPFSALGWGYCTQKPGKLYLTIFDVPAKGILDIPILNAVKKVYILEVPKNKLDVKSLKAGKQIKLPSAFQGKKPMVVVIEITGEPKVASSMLDVQNDGSIFLSSNTAKLSEGLRLIGANTQDPNRPNAIGNWNASSKATWDIKIPKTGKYKILLNYKPSAELDAEIGLSIDNNEVFYSFNEGKGAEFKEVEIGFIEVSQRVLSSSLLKVILKVKKLNKSLPEISSLKLIPVQ